MHVFTAYRFLFLLRQPPLTVGKPDIMNHIRSIKEMLNIPTGSRNKSTSGYTSFTDSQILFGSQFWPENSQNMSQDMSLSSRNSLQSSQEASDPKCMSSYQTKPLLFGETHDEYKSFGIPEFELDKKKAKEKADSDIFAKEFQNVTETLNNIQQLVAGTEKNTAVCQTVLEKFETFASTMQSNLNSLQRDITQQFETLLNKVDTQKETLIDLEKSVQKDSATAEICSNLQSLKSCLDCLREEQKREQKTVEEALKLLNTLVSDRSVKPISERGLDSSTQTTPGLERPVYKIGQDNKLESTPASMSNNPEHKAEGPPQDPCCIKERKKRTLKCLKRHRKRPLVLLQSRKHVVTDENSQPLMDMVTTQKSLSQDSVKPAKKEKTSVSESPLVTPFSCWSQDSNSSVCLPEIEPILEKRSAESRTATPVKPEGLWQWFEMDYDSVRLLEE